MLTDMIGTTPGRSDYVIKRGKGPYEMLICRNGIFFKTSIGHGLPAAGLLHGIMDLAAQLLQKFQTCYTYLRIKLIHVAGNEKADIHGQFALIDLNLGKCPMT